jgi:hypothetical protein
MCHYPQKVPNLAENGTRERKKTSTRPPKTKGQEARELASASSSSYSSFSLLCLFLSQNGILTIHKGMPIFVLFCFVFLVDIN